MRVLLDGSAFLQHTRSGITRHFTELIEEFDADPGIGVEVVTPYRFVANAHLPERVPGRFRHVPLPAQVRPHALALLNRRAAGRDARPYDVVHHALYEPELLDRLEGRARVTMVHDFTMELYPDLFQAWDQETWLADKRRYLEACDVLLCNSENTRQDLARFHPGLDRPAVVTPLGVSTTFFETPGDRVPGIPDRYLLHVGSRHEHKNVDLLFRSFAQLCGRDPELRLVLSGAALTTEEARLRELGIAERTVRVRASDDELARLYAHAQAFVFPSRYEGFGLPVLEAMAAGCPVVVADAPALVEVSGGAAVVVDPDDVEGLTAELERVLSDEGTRRRLRDNGRSRAESYPWRRTAETTAHAYDLALEAVG